MQSKIILASLVAGAAANNLILRQVTDPLRSLPKKCVVNLEEVQNAKDLPKAPEAVTSDMAAQIKTLSDPCAYSPTSSIAAEYTSFVSAVSSWVNAHPTLVAEIQVNCNATFNKIHSLCPNGMGKSAAGDAAAPAAAEPSTVEASGETSGEANGETSGEANGEADGEASDEANGEASDEANGEDTDEAKSSTGSDGNAAPATVQPGAAAANGPAALGALVMAALGAISLL